jgi:hypothetical protein
MQIRAKLGTGPAMLYRVANKQKPPKKDQRISVYVDRFERVFVRVVDVVPLVEGSLFLLERE